MPPSRGYFAPLDQPASTTPYTASDPMASTQRRPTLRSEISRPTRCPSTSTRGPNGIAAKVRKAGTSEATGASK